MRAVLLALSWTAGLLLGMQATVPWPALGLFAVAAAALAPILRRVAASWVLAALPLVLVAGIARPQPLPWTTSLPAVREHTESGPVRLVGHVLEDPEDRRTSVRVRVAAETVSGERVDGRVLVFLPAFGTGEALMPGDRVALTGRLSVPPVFEGFDYRAYLARRGIRAVMYRPRLETLPGAVPGLRRVAAGWRHPLAGSLERAVAEPEGSLARALLLGIRGSLPPDAAEAFRDTGTSHLLAISGLHVALVATMLLAASERLLGRRRQVYLLLPLAGVVAYALLAGMSPSVVRAAVMVGLLLLAYALGRQSSLLPGLAVAGMAMLVVEPGLLKDAGFQLSFAAVLGIGVLGAPLRGLGRDLLDGADIAGAPGAAWLSDVIAVSIAATLFTSPLVAMHFQQVPLLSIPLTIALLPALPPVLVLTAATGFLGLVLPGAAAAIGWADWVFLRYILAMVQGASNLPGGAVAVMGVPAALAAGLYGALLAGGWFLGRRRRSSSASHTPALAELPQGARVLLPSAALFVALVGVFLWVAAWQGPDGRLHVTVLDVGQGDAILVRSPAGHRVLIDGGRDPRVVLGHLGDRLPLGRRRLDLVVLTHPDGDHLNGLVDVVEDVPVGVVLGPGIEVDTGAYERWRAVLEERDTRLVRAREGMAFDLGPGARVELLHPPAPPLAGTGNDVNNNAVVLRIVYGRTSFLLAADIEEAAEASLVRSSSELGSTVLKVAHHGSATSSTGPFLDAVDPLLAVVSVGEDNTFGHPDPDVMDRLAGTARQVLTTAEHGSIELVTDGRSLWVGTDR